MYTNPEYARRGVGRLILTLCEQAATAEGFTRLDLMATMAGRPLYLSHGYVVVEELSDDRGGVPVPLVRMSKDRSLTSPFTQDQDERHRWTPWGSCLTSGTPASSRCSAGCTS
jgi:hypothetical protein